MASDVFGTLTVALFRGLKYLRDIGDLGLSNQTLKEISKQQCNLNRVNERFKRLVQVRSASDFQIQRARVLLPH